MCPVLRGLAALLVLAVAAHGQVPSPPTITKQPEHEHIYQVLTRQDESHRPFVLSCKADGVPDPVYEWTKNNKEFHNASYGTRMMQIPRSGTLVFTQPDDADEGLYQCRASNRYGTAVSNTVLLRKSEFGILDDEGIKDVFVDEGDPLTLGCSNTTGYPRPFVYWLIQMTNGALRMINSSRMTVDPHGSLHFSMVERGDGLDDAVYACSASSAFRQEYKIGNRIQLRVVPALTSASGKAKRAPEKQYLSPPSLVAIREKKLELYCIYGGRPLPQISWSKDGVSPTSSRFKYTNFGKTLVIWSVTFEDEGTYECVANNGVGTAQSHTMAVKVESAPYWLKVPENTNATEGESVSFECSAMGRPEPELQWYLNGVPIEKVKPDPRRKVDGKFLTLEGLVKGDTAVFQCNASNIHGYAFKNFYVNVLAIPPNIVEWPAEVTEAVVTSRVILRCRASGSPNPMVRWRKGTQDVTGGRYHVLDSGDLQIDGLQFADMGTYTCHAGNKFGNATVSGMLAVKGKTKISQPPENYEVAAGRRATFRCNAQVDPSLYLDVRWLFNGEELDLDADPRLVQMNDNSLLITRTAEGDSGVYTCVASTQLDSDRADATLNVQDVPNPPELVRVECEAWTAQVEWRPMGDRRAPILAYTLQYNTSFAPDTWQEAFANIPATDTKFKVSMSPWANYTFRVVAHNKIGASSPSRVSSTCTTPEDVPHKNPDRVEGRGDRPDNLVISWAVSFFHQLDSACAMSSAGQ